MSGPLGSSQWMYSSGFYPYEIEQSLRFNDNDSAYLSRTPASAGNRKTWTWSGWVKRGNLTGVAQTLFGADNSAGNFSSVQIGLDASNRFYFDDNINVSSTYVYSSSVYRDTSAWYHFMCVYDTTEVTASDRMRLYVNGEQITALASGVYPALNTDGSLNSTTAHQLGRNVTPATGPRQYFDGYMAEVNFIDGTALDPTSFGEFKSGVWIPKKYTGSYGTNGFYLSFADSAAIGDDLSGNGNDWTPSGLASTDVLLDSPTNNFCVMSPLWKSANTVLEQGNLYLPERPYYANVVGTMGVSSGKWYFEARVGNSFGSYSEFGVIAADDDSFITEVSSAITGNVTWSQLNKIYNNGTLVTNPTSPNLYNTSTKIVGCALDLDNNKVYFHGNGTWEGSSDPDTNTGGTTIAAAIQGKTFVPLAGTNDVSAAPNTWLNFGQDSSFAGAVTRQGNVDANGRGDFYYAPPAGYLALCTANLPEPTITPARDDVPADYFNTVLYTGNGTSQTVTGFGFDPDFVWHKGRSVAYSHGLVDVLRGDSNILISDATSAEANPGAQLDLAADGATVTYRAANLANNQSAATYAIWGWKAAGAGVANTDGTISSTVSANQKAGFSIVSYTGTGANATVGHGLGVAPAMVIVKARSTTGNWPVYHKVTTALNEIYLNLTGAAARVPGTPTIWQDTNPTSTVFSIGTGGDVNPSGQTMIAYCFAEVEGYSKFGSYTGNGSADGPFVWCGFRPAFVMVKRTDSTSSWRMWDDARRPNNVADATLLANTSGAENTGSNENFDILSNGFKLRNLDSAQNASGGTYIFAAFAEQPFKYSGGR